MSGSLNQARRRSDNNQVIGGQGGRPVYEVKKRAATRDEIIEWLSKKRTGTALDKTTEEKKRLLNSIIDMKQSWIAKAEKALPNPETAASVASQIDRAIPTSRISSAPKALDVASVLFDVYVACNFERYMAIQEEVP